MKALLDTTIQIDRIFGSDRRIARINEVLKGKQLISSTYVLGEYYKNIVNDFVTLYNIFLQENDIKQTGCRITENIFGRSQSRIFKLFNNIAANCSYDLDLIKDSLENYVDILIGRFNEYLIDILDNTNCYRAKATVIYEDGIPILKNILCSKKNKQCCICEFWEKRQNELKKLLKNPEYNDDLKKIIKSALLDPNQFKGINCMKLGDTVIASEILGLTDTVICSSNKKDFEPICKSLNLKLISPDYSERS